MVMPASDSLISICQAQLLLLAKSLEVKSAIVYLTESWTEPGTEGSMPRLYPVAVIPDSMRGDRPGFRLPLAPGGEALRVNRSMGINASSLGDDPTAEFLSEYARPDASPSSDPRQDAHQIVLPLVHEDLVVGVLVAERDRVVTDQEQSQMDAIRQTLTLACVMDRRSQWLDTQLDAQQQQQHLMYRQQKDLMDNLLHQFRNPLTAMRTFGKLLMKRLVETDSNREVASSIVRESDRLQALLVQFEAVVDRTTEHELPNQSLALPAGLLSLPESSSLGRALTVETIDLRLVLIPAVRSARAVTDDRNQTLCDDVPDDPLWVQGESGALEEVLSNLLDNASKYTPPEGKIDLSVELPSAVHNDIVWIHIADNGYGIPAADLPRLFERHFRGVQADSRIPGTGLGLAIARELLRKMGGDLTIVSPTVTGDRGTTVTVTLQRGDGMAS